MLRRCILGLAALTFSFALFALVSPKVLAYGGEDQPDITQALTFNDNLSIGVVQSLPSEVLNLTPWPYAEPVVSPVDCASQPCLALTFDDGPNGDTTPQVLDALDREGAKATFFVVGSRIGGHQDLLKRMEAGGQEVENHSWSHPDFTRLQPQQIRQQIDLTQAAVVAAGLPPPRFFRPPYEARNDQVRRVVNMPFILWNVDVQDWRGKTADGLARIVIEQAKPGAIIILHDTKSITAQALPKILGGLKAQYHFVTVSQLLGLPADAQGEFFSR